MTIHSLVVSGAARIRNRCLLLLFAGFVLSCASLLHAQEASTGVSGVPRLVNFSGSVIDAHGKAMPGVTGITLAIYKDQSGGVPLWLETQTVTADAKGHYTVQLGATKSEGLPVDLFSSNESRWLGVQVSGQEEQPRVLLLSVPYALKAADSETLGGFPASAFMLAAPSAIGLSSIAVSGATNSSTASDPLLASITGSGAVDFLPLWTSTSAIGNSALFQSGTGSASKIGINTTTPTATLDVKGTETVRGALTLPATAAATATTGKTSQSLNLVASSFNSNSGTAVNQTFRWQAEPAGNDTNTTSGTLNLLFGSGANAPAETGLNIANNGKITFVSGQGFPHIIAGVTAGTALTGGGTTGNVTLNVDTTKVVTGVTAGTDLTGGGTGGVLTLNLNTAATDARYARLSATNTFATAQTINNTLSLNAGVSPILNVTASNTGAHAPMAQFGSAGTSDANSIRVYNSGTSNGPFSELFVASDNAFIPGTTAGDGGLRVKPGQNMWFGDTNSPRLELNYVGTLVETGSIYSFPYAPGAAINGYGLSQDNGGSEGGTFYGGTANTTAGSGAQGGSGISVRAGDADFGGLAGQFIGGTGTEQGGWGIVVSAGPGPNAYAGEFTGDVLVSGTINGNVAGVRIDHPLDPANKYLSQTSIQSSEMLSLYSGNATLDAKGEAEVRLPEWFGAVNGDFRYQLTSIGAPGPNLYIAQEVSGGRFRVAGGQPGAKISWQISAVRQDAYAKAHPLVVEQSKTKREQGHYLNPELYGAAADQSIAAARFPASRHKKQTIQDVRNGNNQAPKPWG
jgi:trimeric autotransporter adhesin